MTAVQDLERFRASLERYVQELFVGERKVGRHRSRSLCSGLSRL